MTIETSLLPPYKTSTSVSMVCPDRANSYSIDFQFASPDDLAQSLADEHERIRKAGGEVLGTIAVMAMREEQTAEMSRVILEVARSSFDGSLPRSKRGQHATDERPVPFTYVVADMPETSE